MTLSLEMAKKKVAPLVAKAIADAKDWNELVLINLAQFLFGGGASRSGRNSQASGRPPAKHSKRPLNNEDRKLFLKELGPMNPYTPEYQEKLKKLSRASRGLSQRTISGFIKAERRLGRLKPHSGRRKAGAKK